MLLEALTFGSGELIKESGYSHEVLHASIRKTERSQYQ